MRQFSIKYVWTRAQTVGLTFMAASITIKFNGHQSCLIQIEPLVSADLAKNQRNHTLAESAFEFGIDRSICMPHQLINHSLKDL